MTVSSHSRPAWRNSSYSGQNGNCLEVAVLSPAVAVRDSKDPDGHHLAFPLATWRAFARRIRAAELASAVTCPPTHQQQASSPPTTPSHQLRRVPGSLFCPQRDAIPG
jgi:Domain of unknown function (DUF397)